MKNLLVLVVLCSLVTLAGCGRGGEPADFGVGDAGVSGGTGGDGSGPTGTQGAVPADNPAADSPKSNGAGGP